MDDSKKEKLIKELKDFIKEVQSDTANELDSLLSEAENIATV